MFLALSGPLNLFRLWVTGGAISILYLLWKLSNFPNGLGFFWGTSQFKTIETSIYVLLMLTGIGILWTRRFVFGVLLILIVLLIQRGMNPSLYWGWIWVFPPLVFFRMLSLRLTNERWRTYSYGVYLFYILSIYWIPSLDRLTFSDWFNGRMISVFISSVQFARFPVYVSKEWDIFFAPISISVFLLEFLVPLLFLAYPNKKIFSRLMLGFHVALMIFSDVHYWHPLMALIWLDQYLNGIELSLKLRKIVFLMLIPLTIFSFIWGKKVYMESSSHPISRGLKLVGLQSFSSMKMFSVPNIPVTVSMQTIYNYGGTDFEVPHELGGLFREMFLNRRNHIGPSVLCDPQNPVPVKLIFIKETREKGKTQYVLEEDCSP